MGQQLIFCSKLNSFYLGVFYSFLITESGLEAKWSNFDQAKK